MNAHLKRHRENSCPHCERTFRYEDILEKHIKIAHEGTKLYCHFFNNEKICPFEQDCIFLHEHSTQCIYEKLCERNNCMYKHSSNEKHDSEKHDDKQYENEDMKVTCENCDFVAADDLSLEVHYQREHSGYFECAFCEYSAKDEEGLNTHLHTCETFTCEVCEPKFMVKKLPDLITHLLSNHSNNLKNTNIIHIKMDRKNVDKVSRRTVSSEYFTRQA